MKSSDFRSNSLYRKLMPLCLTLAACISNAQTGDDSRLSKVYCLSERIYSDVILFADVSTGEGVSTTNAPVIMSYTAAKIPSAAEDGYFTYAISVDASIDQWLDFKGFVHTTDVLRRQVSFNNWISQLSPEMSKDISPVLMTGILDRPTLWASYSQMQYHLDYAQSHLRKLCAVASDRSGPCEGPPWPNGEIQLIADALGPASQAATNYKAELATVSFIRPMPYEGLCDDARSKALEYRLPSVIYGHFDSYRDFLKENAVTESVDLTTMGMSKLSRLASLEQDAQRRIKYLADLSGDPN